MAHPSGYPPPDFGRTVNTNDLTYFTNKLAALQQRDNVDEYVDEFELITTMIPRESEALYVGYFMNGLKDEANMWLGTLLLERSEDIYRMKSLLSVQGMDERFVF